MTQISDRLAASLRGRGIHYGWVIVGTTFLVMLATAGAMGSAGILIAPLETEFGWTNAQISTALSLRLVVFGLAGPFAAAFMGHFGVRRVVTAALVMIAIGVFGSLFVREVWQLVVVWGVIVGLGTGMTALVLGAIIATRWFEAQRGFVVGLLTASMATGQLVFLPLLAWVSERIGWRPALMIVVVVLTLALILVRLLMRDGPADVGLSRYGSTAVESGGGPRLSLGQMLLEPLRTLREVSGSTTFWALAASFFVCGFSTNGLIQTHWIALCADYGIRPTGAAGMLAIIGAFDLVGTLLSGWLSDRYDNRWLLFWYYSLRGLSLMYLPFSDFSVLALSLFAVFYGLDWIATVPPTVKLTAQRFGAEKAGMVFGWVFASHQLGAAAAAYAAGASRTGLATYAPAIFAAGALCLLAALMMIALRRPAVEQIA
jgi:sugar phosphate permease